MAGDPGGPQGQEFGRPAAGDLGPEGGRRPRQGRVGTGAGGGRPGARVGPSWAGGGDRAGPGGGPGAGPRHSSPPRRASLAATAVAAAAAPGAGSNPAPAVGPGWVLGPGRGPRGQGPRNPRGIGQLLPAADAAGARGRGAAAAGPGMGQLLAAAWGGAGPKQGPGGAQAPRVMREASWGPSQRRCGRPRLGVGLIRGDSVPACLEPWTGELGVFVWLDGRSTRMRSRRGCCLPTGHPPKLCCPPRSARALSLPGPSVVPLRTACQETHFP